MTGSTKLYYVIKTDEYGRTYNEFYTNAHWCLNREAADTFSLEEADQLIDDLNDYWKSKGIGQRADKELASPDTKATLFGGR